MILSHVIYFILLIYTTSQTLGDKCKFDNALPTVDLIEIVEPSVEERIDCHPDEGATRLRCLDRGCTWEPTLEIHAPWCYHPPGYGYEIVGEPVQTKDGYVVHLRRTVHQHLFGGESNDIWVQVFKQNNHRIRITATDDNPSRFIVPIDIPSEGREPSDPEYEISFTSSPTFGIRVTRRSTGELVLDTSLPGLVYADQFIQLPMRFPAGSNLYGWGENEQNTFAHNMHWSSYGLYGRDQPPDGNTNMYGTHPRLTLLDKNGDAAGILFLNSAAQEISLVPMPGAIYRTIGGILDMYIFLGPSPENVVQQYTEAVGRTPLPPYWSLGFHLCRYGYNSIEKMQEARDRMVKYKIPQDAQWGDIDIMERQLDFTIDPVNFNGLPEYVKELKNEGVRFVTILDPCISTGEPDCTYRPFTLGEQFGIWVNKPDKTPVVGKVWPDDPVYFPDYTNERTKEWWTILIKEFHDLISFDGLWIDMNEPANFVAGDLNDGCTKNKINYPPYVPQVRIDDGSSGLSEKTLCGDAVHSKGLHYDIHNMFGWYQSEPTLDGVRAATGKRGLVLSRSTYVGSGRWVAHWLGDNFSNWTNLKNSIIGMLQFNQFGIPLVGADICGFIGNTTAELCTRWQQLGAFYPFSRNHNALGSIEQDPGVFGEEVARIVKKVLEIRYSLLPYLYTLFYDHNTQGNTVARPVWHEFPRDNVTWSIDEQFMWGQGLLISPVLHQGDKHLYLYLPPGARWYTVTDFLDSKTFSESLTGWQNVSAPLDEIPLHLRGGVAIPLQNPAQNTVLSRANNFKLVFPLDAKEEASGHLFYDDGESLGNIESGSYLFTNFKLQDQTISWKVENSKYEESRDLLVEEITVLGLGTPVTTVLVNGESHADFESAKGRLHIRDINQSIDQDFTVEFQ